MDIITNTRILEIEMRDGNKHRRITIERKRNRDSDFNDLIEQILKMRYNERE